MKNLANTNIYDRNGDDDNDAEDDDDNDDSDSNGRSNIFIPISFWWIKRKINGITDHILETERRTERERERTQTAEANRK